MKSVCYRFFLLGLLFIKSAAGEDLITDFTEGYIIKDAVAGQKGWIIDDAVPDLSYFIRLNGKPAACLGGLYGAPNAGSVSLSHAVENPLAGSLVSCSLAFISSTPTFPNADIFSISLTGPEGENLLSLRFIPAAANPDMLEIHWSTGTSPAVRAGAAIFHDAPYTVRLKLTPDWAPQPGFTAVIDGSTTNTFGGTLPPTVGKTLRYFAVGWTATSVPFGNNYVALSQLTVGRTPVTDADRDGYSAEQEAWFGTSDADRLQIPVPQVFLGGGSATVRFPSVPGNAYVVESSENLTVWEKKTVTAVGREVIWETPVRASGRSFFRVGKP